MKNRRVVIFKVFPIIFIFTLFTSCKSIDKISTDFKKSHLPAPVYPVSTLPNGRTTNYPLHYNNKSFYLFGWDAVPKADFYTLQIIDLKTGKIFKQFTDLKKVCFCYEESDAQKDFRIYFNTEIRNSTIILGWKVLATKQMKKSNKIHNIDIQSDFQKFVFGCGGKNCSEMKAADQTFFSIINECSCISCPDK